MTKYTPGLISLILVSCLSMPDYSKYDPEGTTVSGVVQDCSVACPQAREQCGAEISWCTGNECIIGVHGYNAAEEGACVEAALGRLPSASSCVPPWSNQYKSNCEGTPENSGVTMATHTYASGAGSAWAINGQDTEIEIIDVEVWGRLSNGTDILLDHGLDWVSLYRLLDGGQWPPDPIERFSPNRFQMVRGGGPYILHFGTDEVRVMQPDVVFTYTRVHFRGEGVGVQAVMDRRRTSNSTATVGSCKDYGYNLGNCEWSLSNYICNEGVVQTAGFDNNCDFPQNVVGSTPPPTTTPPPVTSTPSTPGVWTITLSGGNTGGQQAEVVSSTAWPGICTFNTFPVTFTASTSVFNSTSTLNVQWPVGNPSHWLCNVMTLTGSASAVDPTGLVWYGYAVPNTSGGCNIGFTR